MKAHGEIGERRHHDPAEHSIEVAMRELRCRPRNLWLDYVRGDQSERWRRGAAVHAEEYFAQLPELLGDAEEALVLICGEVQLRREVGQYPALAEYQQRFPQFSGDLEIQFEVDSVLETIDCAPPVEDEPAAAIELPGYEFIERIGSGAAGIVYKARQNSLNRLVAIKVLALAGADEKVLARQGKEAEILARLRHANVVHVYEVMRHRDRLFLVMEFVDGPTLAERTRGKPLAAHDAAKLLVTLAHTVHAVHEAGILHRDLKPSNVLMNKLGEIKIADFGLAKLDVYDSGRTVEDSVLGTPSYMAPEQAAGNIRAIGPATDVYSLGAILYELLTGRPPFLGATILDTLSLIRAQDPVRPRQLLPRIPRDLETICLKCLEKPADQRYSSAAALADDLRRFLDGLPIQARPPGSLERFARLVKRKPAAAAAIVSLMLLAGVVRMAVWSNREQHRRLSAEALVGSIATADAQSLPQLLTILANERDLAIPLVRAELTATAPQESKWVNLSVAALAVDPNAATTPLLNYLPSARPVEISTIVQELARRPNEVVPAAWKMLLNDASTDNARLNLACLAARTTPDDEQWSKIAPAVARAMTRQHPFDAATFSKALLPVRESLTPALVEIFRNGGLDPLAKSTSVSILARFAADQPETLIDLIVETQPNEFRLLLPSLEQPTVEARSQLETIANEVISFEKLVERRQQKTEFEIESTYDRAQRRRTNAYAALWLLGEPAEALKALKTPQDPALRSWLVELLAPLGVSADSLWTKARETSDSRTRQALLLALGQIDFEQGNSTDRDTLIAGLVELYRNDPDAGVHSACAWLLKNRLNSAPTITTLTSARLPPSADRDWYIGPNGHTFALLRGPRTFTMGSPSYELSREDDEVLHEEHIDRTLAVATTEVTIEQFLKFRQKYFNRRYSPTDDCPANNINWFDAAAYCRWLSEQEGIAEDQMCYPPLAEITPGMTLPADCLQRTGYRLPTEVEWEYLCRGGVGASRPWGEGEELMTRYAWFLKNSDNHCAPIGQLKPNDVGLFDVMGNIAERCHDAYHSSRAAAEANNPADVTVRAEDARAFRGGNFGDIDQANRAARRMYNAARDEWALIGFRVVRTLKSDVR